MTGIGVPEGTTAYVLTIEEEGQDNLLWNPVTADRFPVGEANFCPLQKVYAIVNEGN